MIKRDTPESIKLDSMGLEEDFLLTHGFKDVMLERSEASWVGWLRLENPLLLSFRGKLIESRLPQDIL
jgi:hypothetical protein